MILGEVSVLTTTGPRSIQYDVATVRKITSRENSAYCLDFLACWTSLLADSPLTSTRGPKPYRLFSWFQKDLMSRHLKESIGYYSDLADRLMANSHTTGSGDLSGPFIHELLDSPVGAEYVAWFRSGRPDLLKFLLTFLRFGKKLEYQDEGFYTTAFRKWLDVEDTLTLVSAGFTPAKLRYLKNQVLALLDDFWLSVPFMGKFGPKNVSDGYKGPIEKSQNFSLSPKLMYALSSNGPFKDVIDGGTDSIRGSIPGNWSDVKLESITNSTLRFVPKNIKTARSICMEPNGYMFVQQHVFSWLNTMIDNSYLGRFVTLRDQEPNRDGAAYGSWSGNVDTIDLSSASDTVSLALVKAIFPRPILYWLLATRSGDVKLPNGELKTVSKFAPMGSAVCFPVQCIVFAAITLQAYMASAYGVDPETVFSQREIKTFLDSGISDRLGVVADRPGTSVMEPFRVFGDDILCDSRTTKYVLHILTGLGFVPNVEKSFTGSQAFRESCGKYFWNGHDVTPIHYQTDWWMSVRCISNCAGTAALAERFRTEGFARVAKHLRSVLLNIPIQGIFDRKLGVNPFNRSEDVSKYSLTLYGVGTYSAKRRWNGDLQRFEVKSIGASPIKETVGDLSFGIGAARYRSYTADSYNRYKYGQYWRALSNHVPDFDEPSKRGWKVTFGQRASWRWTPSWD